MATSFEVRAPDDGTLKATLAVGRRHGFEGDRAALRTTYAGDASVALIAPSPAP